MPVVVEALPRDQWEAWVLEQGGSVGSTAVVEADAEIALPKPFHVTDLNRFESI